MPSTAGLLAAFPLLWGSPGLPGRGPRSDPPIASLSPGQQCRAAIATAERSHGIPDALLAAIGLVETGRPATDGRLEPWPWSLNVEGVDHVYDDRAQAVAALRGFLTAGARSIDVGCLQVNLKYHPDAFANPEDGFDPVRNAGYAADFLVQLRGQTGSWLAATAAYHSATPELGGPYAQKVMALWPTQAGRQPAPDDVRALHPGALPVPALPVPGVMSAGGIRPAVAPRLLAAASSANQGRGLAEYRAHPVRLANIARP